MWTLDQDNDICARAWSCYNKLHFSMKAFHQMLAHDLQKSLKLAYFVQIICDI